MSWAGHETRMAEMREICT